MRPFFGNIVAFVAEWLADILTPVPPMNYGSFRGFRRVSPTTVPGWETDTMVRFLHPSPRKKSLGNWFHPKRKDEWSVVLDAHYSTTTVLTTSRPPMIITIQGGTPINVSGGSW